MARNEPTTFDIPEGIRPRIALISTRWNADIVELLRRGARRALESRSVSGDLIDEIVVPGALELPLAAEIVASSKGADGIVVIGAVVRGETPHFDVVTRGATDGIVRVSLDYRIPVGFGLLTVDSHDQALERADPDRLDKGGEAALTALAMVGVLDGLRE